jgi:predicted ATP-grasp superfamily ATP-dependent carboligase
LTLPHVLICGASTRAAAESAARAGFVVTALDGYADLDQHPSVRALSLPRDFDRPMTPRAAARASRSIDCDAVVYLSSFENHPRAVARLAEGRALWGNGPDVLVRVRDPVLLAEALSRRGFPVPEVRPARGAGDLGAVHDWMIKPLRSGGGRRVRRWNGRPRRDAYLQQRIDGMPASIVFVASGRKVVPLGLSRQLIGEQAFGADEYRYCGSILGSDAIADRGSATVERLCALAAAVADEFVLTGVNGIDVIVAAGVPYAIEVNPRWSSSMELVERNSGLSVFGAHAAACSGGVLPSCDVMDSIRSRGSAGKAIVFARHTGVAGDTTQWLADPSIRDVPRSGEAIAAGQPVCTVLAEADTASACHALLVRKADQIYAQLSAWRSGS